MSSPEECKLKGGHPPAVKAGGMRIIQHKTPKEDREIKPIKDVDESKPSSSGVPAKGNADFPPEAVQVFHEKPIPTHNARPTHCSRPIIIQQPRK
ncbi:Death-associated protein 1 [Melipona quadrifasciata]|uniref:Death-associated protein 1 n=1 Tax=Melipona quadrifasciata TaxID=166423 RepID=A0A0N0BFA4_9HYME|nr:Death-associated protein 1 [Melipona quadrifasciata]